MTAADSDADRPKDERVWGGTTLEERRAFRRGALMTAALDMIGEEGSSAVSVRSLCRRVGLNDRYFYESFQGRDEFLRTLYEEVSADAFAAVTEAVGDVPADDHAGYARTALGAFIAWSVDDIRKGRLIAVDGLTDPAYAGLSFTTAVALGQIIARTVPKSDSSAERAISVVALTGSIGAVIGTWIQGGLKVSREQLLAHCVSAVIRASIPGAELAD